jgi:hypothetical protein
VLEQQGTTIATPMVLGIIKGVGGNPVTVLWSLMCEIAQVAFECWESLR